MRNVRWWAALAFLMWAVPAGAAEFSLGADVDADYFFHSNKVGGGFNVYPGMDGGGGLVGELQLGYNYARTSEVLAVYPVYVGFRYDFADVIGSNDWHPILAAHAGLSIMHLQPNIVTALPSGGSTVTAGSNTVTDGGLGTNVALGLNWSESNDHSLGLVVAHNWAGSQNGITTSWLSVGVAGRMVF